MHMTQSATLPDLAKTIREARRVGVPLVYITTPDPEGCMRKLDIGGSLKTIPADEENPNCPVLIWDIDRGIVARNDEGTHTMQVAKIQQPKDSPMAPNDAAKFLAALTAARQLQCQSVFFMMVPSPDTLFKPATVQQRIYNLRDELKSFQTMIIFLGPDHTFPAAISNDIMKVTDPRPSVAELADITQRQYQATKIDYPSMADLSEETLNRAALGMQGLTTFSAETAIAMAIKSSGINFEILKQQRYSLIERDGLKVWKGSERFDDIKGLDGACRLLKKVVTSDKKKIGAIVYLEEIEKAMAGSGGGDRSGMADKQLARTLTFLEDRKIPGALFLGPPGCGKSELSKALGNETDRITLEVDLGLVLNSLMGASEHNLEEVFNIILAVSGGSPFVIASCNSADNLPTSLLRRFRTARFFFGPPNAAAKLQIWDIKMKKYGLEEQLLPDDTDWTGFDIEVCCERAWLFGDTLVETAKTIIPVLRSKPAELEALKRAAHNSCLDAATGLPFVLESSQEERTKKQTSRKIATLDA